VGDRNHRWIYGHPGPLRPSAHCLSTLLTSGSYSKATHPAVPPHPVPRPQDPSISQSSHYPSLPPQTFGRQPSCLQSLRPAPVTRSRRPVPWVSCCSAVVRHPKDGFCLGPLACRVLPDPLAQQDPQMPTPPGSGEAAATTWTSGTRSQGSLWTRSTSGVAETSVRWCNCTTTRQADWCVWAGSADA
jgi:hypothetical protein